VDAWELVARESIRDLVARYNANGDSGRFDQVLECFAPNATMEMDGLVYRGQAQIRTIFTNAAEVAKQWSEPLGMRHFTSTLQIDLTNPEDLLAVTTRSSPRTVSITGVATLTTTRSSPVTGVSPVAVNSSTAVPRAVGPPPR